MTVYHGTVSTNLSAILRDGLSPHPEQQFNLTHDLLGPNIRDLDASKKRSQHVYVTPSLEWATFFATLRANYLKSRSGEYVKAISPYDGLMESTPFNKASDLPFDPDAEPVVLKIDLPNSWYLGVDKQLKEDGKLSRPIPPRYITVLPHHAGEKELY